MGLSILLVSSELQPYLREGARYIGIWIYGYMGYMGGIWIYGYMDTAHIFETPTITKSNKHNVFANIIKTSTPTSHGRLGINIPLTNQRPST